MAQTLRGDLPALEHFCTLSPAPGFTRWLTRAAGAEASGPPGEPPLLSDDEAAEVRRLLAHLRASEGGGGEGLSEAEARSGGAALASLLALPGHDAAVAGAAWHGDEACQRGLEPVLCRLSARYLAREKRGGRGAKEGPAPPAALDPVANFHLRNGARLHNINWAADPSAKGLAASCGIMVNYLYDLPAIAASGEGYADRGEVACSPAVRELLE